MISRVIGGEFDLNVQETLKKNIGFTSGYLYSSGRAALFNILFYIKTNSRYTRILLPDYLCSSVLEAVEKLDLAIDFYKIQENLTPHLNDLGNKLNGNTIVLLINYFGCVDCGTAINYIKSINANIPVIQDNVQALFDMYNENRADFTFTSFRKTLPAPDGAWVKTKQKGLPAADCENTFAGYKIAGGILKYTALSHQAEIDDGIYLDLFRIGEDKINDNYNAAPSDISLTIIQEFHREKVAAIRKENARIITEGLKNMNIDTIINIQDNHVPLFVPARFANRDIIRKALFKHNIFCPVHWPVPDNYNLARGKEMAANELSVIIDQRYTNQDMYRILDIIQKFYSHEN